MFALQPSMNVLVASQAPSHNAQKAGIKAVKATRAVCAVWAHRGGGFEKL